jgi:hypothetical protein
MRNILGDMLIAILRAPGFIPCLQAHAKHSLRYAALCIWCLVKLTLGLQARRLWSGPMRLRAEAARQERDLQPFDVKPNTACPYLVSLTESHIEIMWFACWKARSIVAQREPALVVRVHIQLSVPEKSGRR